MPTMILYMIGLDIVCMIMNLFIYLTIFIIMLTPYKRQAYEFNERFQNKMFASLLDITSMDADGFKS